jgi:hypothetical protein
VVIKEWCEKIICAEFLYHGHVLYSSITLRTLYTGNHPTTLLLDKCGPYSCRKFLRVILSSSPTKLCVRLESMIVDTRLVLRLNVVKNQMIEHQHCPLLLLQSQSIGDVDNHRDLTEQKYKGQKYNR